MAGRFGTEYPLGGVVHVEAAAKEAPTPEDLLTQRQLLEIEMVKRFEEKGITGEDLFMFLNLQKGEIRRIGNRTFYGEEI